MRRAARSLQLLLATSLVAAQPGFAAHVTNPWFPLKPGTTYVYTGERTVRVAAMSSR
jgi:hypothetical protein